MNPLSVSAHICVWCSSHRNQCLPSASGCCRICDVSLSLKLFSLIDNCTCCLKTVSWFESLFTVLVATYSHYLWLEVGDSLFQKNTLVSVCYLYPVMGFVMTFPFIYITHFGHFHHITSGPSHSCRDPFLPGFFHFHGFGYDSLS